MDKLNKAAGKVKAAVHPNKKLTVTERFNEAAEKIKAVDANQTSNDDKLVGPLRFLASTAHSVEYQHKYCCSSTSEFTPFGKSKVSAACSHDAK